MNSWPGMNDLPEFVTEEEQTPQPQASLTGWETVIFELDDADLQAWGSAFSTAALAP